MYAHILELEIEYFPEAGFGLVGRLLCCIMAIMDRWLGLFYYPSN